MHLPKIYTSPTTQIVLVGITCFATVGMYSAVTNLGGGGIQDVALADISNGVLYGTFALTGLFSGGINNILGPRLTLFLGSLGYAVYVGALWCFQTQGTRWFLILAGALLGVSAALLWSAQGAIMMSYPLEKDKGKAFGIFWAIFQFGSLVGSIIALSINLNSSTDLSSVSNTTYLVFLIIIFFGIASTWLLLPPNRVVRSDGTLVKLETVSRRPRDEMKSLWKVLRDWRIVALMPVFFSGIYCYAYLGAINAFAFDGVTRALNATLESLGAITGALFIGFFVLDSMHLPNRRARGLVGLFVVTLLTVGVWACGLVWQLQFTRHDKGAKFTPPMHYKEARYRTKGVLFFFYYFSDACYQALTYWIMGAISNDPFTLARYAGLCKAIQSAGAAASFGMDAVATPFLNELLASWIIRLVSLPLAGLVIYSIKETNCDDTEKVDDLKVPHLEAATDHANDTTADEKRKE